MKCAGGGASRPLLPAFQKPDYMNKLLFLPILLAFVTSVPTRAWAQVLETEESKPLMPGQFEVGTGLEFQTSKEGTEFADPIAIEYGLSKRLTLLVEPVPYTSIMPKEGRTTRGAGDVEVTAFYQVCTEQHVRPSISIAAEVKIPTAHNALIGTGRTDWTPYVILSKTTGKFFTSANLSYTFLGKPPGVDVANLFNYAIGTLFEFHPEQPKWVLFGEVYGNTSALGGSEQPEGDMVATTPIVTSEISGGETVVAAGFGVYVKPTLLISLGVSYDNNHATLFRPGIEWKFGGKPN